MGRAGCVRRSSVRAHRFPATCSGSVRASRIVEPTEENLKAFDALHRARHEPDVLPPIVARTLGDLTKKKVLHLLCSTGEATAALADLGAVVTGLDPRHAMLEAARER